MKIKLKHLATAMILLTVLSCSKEDRKLQAFVVIGLGNGIALSGGEVFFFDDDFSDKILPLKQVFLKENEKLATSAIENAPLGQRNTLENLEAKIKQISIKLDAVSNEKNAIFEKIPAQVEKIKSEEKKRVTQEIEDSEKRINSLLEIQKNYKNAIEKYNPQIIKLTSSIKNWKNNEESLIKEIDNIVNNYIKNNNLKAKQVALTVYDFETSRYVNRADPRAHFSFPNRLYNRSKYKEHNQEFGKLTGVESYIVQKVENEVVPRAQEIIVLKDQILTADQELENLKNLDAKAVAPFKNKYGNIENVKNSLTEERMKLRKLKEELSEIDTERFKENIESKERLEYGERIKQTKENLEQARNDLKKCKDNIVKEYENVFNKEMSDRLMSEMRKIAMRIERTDLDGIAKIPRGAEFVYFQANMLFDQKYSWLVKIDKKQDTFQLSNFNITEKSDILGWWVFTALEKYGK
jgi:DNA repair ATPase RecN